jgi:transcriptional regulator with XRE-family HTH domain
MAAIELDLDHTAENRARQRELYGAPLGERVRRLTTGLGISQARVARTVGISPAMLSQLVSGRRVKIGDPAVLARLRVLDERGAAMPVHPDPVAVDELLAEVAAYEFRWAGPRLPEQRTRQLTPAEVLRGVTDPARLAAAAAALNPSFPELAEVLWQAAARGR